MLGFPSHSHPKQSEDTERTGRRQQHRRARPRALGDAEGAGNLGGRVPLERASVTCACESQ